MFTFFALVLLGVFLGSCALTLTLRTERRLNALERATVDQMCLPAAEEKTGKEAKVVIKLNGAKSAAEIDRCLHQLTKYELRMLVDLAWAIEGRDNAITSPIPAPQDSPCGVF